MLNFDGSQDGSNFVGPSYELIKSKNVFSDFKNSKISNLLTELGIGKNELAIDSTHVVKSLLQQKTIKLLRTAPK